MKIRIEKSNGSIGYEYLVYNEDEIIYSAISEKLSIFYKLTIWRKNGEEKIIKIKNNKLRLFKPAYFVFYKKQKVEFKTISFYKRHFQFEYEREMYDIYGHHKSWKYSVFKNRKQIARWDKETTKWQGPDIFKIDLNKDVNIELIISFCLILDDHIEFAIEDRGKLIDMDLDFNLNWKKYGELKSYDKNWEPDN